MNSCRTSLRREGTKIIKMLLKRQDIRIDYTLRRIIAFIFKIFNTHNNHLKLLRIIIIWNIKRNKIQKKQLAINQVLILDNVQDS